MNIVSLFYFFSFLVFIYLAIYVLRLNPRASLNMSFFGLCLSMGVWALSLGFMIASANLEEALFWRKVGVFGGALFPALYLHFSLLLTHRGKSWMYPLLYVPALLLMYERLRPGGSISTSGLVYSEWGWDYLREFSLWHYLFDFYLIVYIVVGVGLVFWWGRCSPHNSEKNQSRLIIYTMALTLALGLITDVILPYMGIVFPQVGVIFLLIHSYGIWLAIIRYRMMTLTPAFVVEDILKTMNDPVIVFGSDGIAKISNQAGQKKLGYDEEEMKRITMDDIFIHKPGVWPAEGPVEYFFEHNGENELLSKEGKTIPVSYSCSVIYDEAGEVTGVVYVLHDITQRKRNEKALQQAYEELEKRVHERTVELAEANNSLLLENTERKQAEEALRKSEEHFRQIVELLPVAVIIYGEEQVVFANSAAANLVQENHAQDLISTSLTEYLEPEDVEEFTQQLQQVKGNEKQTKLYAKIDLGRGRTIDAELIMTPFTYQGSQTVLIVIYDLTRRKNMEEEIFKVDKLESIGMLAGGIAHDFNNYLATLLGNISMIRIHQDKPEKIQQKLQNMEKATLRAKELTHQLFVFAKGGAPVKKTISASSLINDIISFTLCGSNVRSYIKTAEELHTVEIDEGQISQVLNNIIINAVQSMPEGGNLWVTAENVVIEANGKDHLVPLPAGNYVRIAVTDEGSGISRELLPKIFDPFFTTKPGGSGLGLATSYSIVKNHGGYLTVQSEEGIGSTFYIYLPASRKSGILDVKYSDTLNGSGKILVMDDEESVRKITGEMLSFLGYETHFAKDGREALQIFANAHHAGSPFDLVMMDLTVPGGMGGKSTIKELQRLDPSVKAIVFSGYSDDPVMAQYESYGFKGIIKKPFTTEELSNVVYGVIHQH